MIDLSIVIAVDAKTIEQAYYSLPTWYKHRQEMWSMPWVVIYDIDQIKEERIDKLIEDMMLPAVRVPWRRTYDTQREKMLTAWVHVPPRAVETQWWAKIDTDVLAKPHDNWLDPAWFEPDENGTYAEYIASGWGYTKPKAGGTALEWCDALEDWGDQYDTPRLDLYKHVNGSRISHKRMCSWVSYYNTEATKDIAHRCDWKLPVPSQDTVVWYAVARKGGRFIHASMKKRGWTTISKTRRLKEAAAEIMND